MGSYLSIHNDTPYTAYVSLGPDTAALSIAGYCFTAVGAVAGVGALTCVAAGHVAGVVGAALGSEAIATAGTAALAGPLGACTGVGVVTAGSSVACQIGQGLEQKGMVKIQPGELRPE